MIVTKKISDTRVKIRVAIFIFILLTPLWILIIVDGWLFSKAKVIDGTLKYKGNEYFYSGNSEESYMIYRKNRIGYRSMILEPTFYYSVEGDNYNNVIVVEDCIINHHRSNIFLKNGVTYDTTSEPTGVLYCINVNDKEVINYVSDNNIATIMNDYSEYIETKLIEPKTITAEIAIGVCYSNLPIGKDITKREYDIGYCEDGSWVREYGVKHYQGTDGKMKEERTSEYKQYQITDENVIEILNGFMSELSK